MEMGSQGENGIDATVGGLVWVRRRNGAWWPGQIIDINEGSENLVTSPRNGTPIKLLGKDDPIVDWYNLEKSKRVKPFRCGDFNIWINNAKLTAANSSKRGLKYARREDAILQALDIEMEKENGEIDKLTKSESIGDEFNGLNGKDNSVQDLIEDLNQARSRRTPNDSEDEETEGVKRMRGLDDLGMGVVSPRRGKKTQGVNFNEFFKRKDRRKALSKVLESTSIVSVPIASEKTPYRNEFGSTVINNSAIKGVSYENRILRNEIRRGFESVLVSCKQKERYISNLSAKTENLELFDVPLVARRVQPGGTPLNMSNQMRHIDAAGKFSESFRVNTVNFGNKELNEYISTSSCTTDIDNGNSKWQSKGRRNSRNTFRSRKDIDEDYNVDLDEDYNDDLDEYWGCSSRRSSTKEAIGNGPKILPYRQSRSIVNPKYGPEFSMMDSEEPITELYDVYLEVKASSRPQHVPYISLRSKLTDQPVIGHPITVESLEEGSTDTYMTAFVSPKDLKSHHFSPVTSTKLLKSATSSKKIRKLSSLTSFSSLSRGARNLVAENITRGAVPCVPIKVVYSRMNSNMRGSICPPRRFAKLQNL